MTTPPAPFRSLCTRRRRAGAALVRALVPGLAAGVVALLVSSCGSSPDQDAPQKTVSLAPSPVFPEMAGPCDQHHQDAAIAAAAAAIRQARGQVRLDRPAAHFGSRYTHPQMPGQPSAPPAYGWWVSFAIQEAEPSPSQTPTQAPLVQGGDSRISAAPPAIYHQPAVGQRDLAQAPDLEQTAELNREQMRQGPRGIAEKAPAIKQMPPPPDPTKAPGADSGAMHAPLGMPMGTQATGAASAAPRPDSRPGQVGVFVAIDGSVSLN